MPDPIEDDHAETIQWLLDHGVLPGHPLMGPPRHSEIHNAVRQLIGIPGDVGWSADDNIPDHLLIGVRLLALDPTLPAPPPITHEAFAPWHTPRHQWETEAIRTLLDNGTIHIRR